MHRCFVATLIPAGSGPIVCILLPVGPGRVESDRVTPEKRDQIDGELNPSAPLKGQFFEPSAPRQELTYGELNPSAPLKGQLLEPSAPRLALTYGESNPSAPSIFQLLLTVSSAPGANLWWVKLFT